MAQPMSNDDDSERYAAPYRRARQPHSDHSGATDSSFAVGLKPAYQPIVSLADNSVVGFEALARWTHRPDLGPMQMFAQAAADGRLDELDRECMRAAINGALTAGIGRGLALFINSEPTTRYVGSDGDDVVATGRDALQLTIELTERGLLEHPSALMRKVDALRSDGMAIALDDVGAHPDSLALLDIIRPDVVKLDMRLVQSHPHYEQARVASAVIAHHERAGGVIIAEGIETETHRERARALGATMGQGYFFGRPGPIEQWSTTAPRQAPVPRATRSLTAVSPFEFLAQRCPVRTTRKHTLLALTRYVESQAGGQVDPSMVFAAVQNSEHFTGFTRRRYRELAQTAPLVVVFGRGLATDLGSGIRGVALDDLDPLGSEWIVLTLGAHTSAALVARERPGQDPSVAEADRRFDMTITYDRSLVTVAARSLLDRMP